LGVVVERADELMYGIEKDRSRGGPGSGWQTLSMATPPTSTKPSLSLSEPVSEGALAREIVDQGKLERETLWRLHVLASQIFGVLDPKRIDERARKLIAEYTAIDPLAGTRIPAQGVQLL
jgi:hypothetical protein